MYERNDKYHPSLEGSNIHATKVREATGLDNEHIPLLSQLQSIHDDEEPETWKERLKATAEMHSLSDKILETL